MIEQTDAPQGGAEGVDTSAAVGSTSEATTEQQTGAENTGQADDAGEATEEPKRVPWFQKRIDEVTASKYEAQREAAYWRGLAEANQRQEQPPKQEAAAALPTLEQFNYDEAAYQAALTKHIREETEKTLDRTLSEREKRATETQKTNTALTKLQEGGSKHPDFVAAVSDIPANEAVRDFVLTTDNAADVLYSLGKDGAALQRFIAMTPVQQAIELGRRAAAPAPAAARTIAPPPPQTVNGLSGSMNKPADQMTMAEYAAARKAGTV